MYAKWKLFHATDFGSLMYTAFAMNTIVGFFPYKVEPRRIVFSRKRFVWGILIIFVNWISLIVVLYQLNFSHLVPISVTRTIHSNIYMLTDGVVTLIMYMLSRARLPMLQAVQCISMSLEPKDFSSMSKLIYAKDILGVLFLLSHVPQCFEGYNYVTLRHLTGLFMMFTNFCLNMLYMNLVCVIKACFRRLNENLTQLKEPLIRSDPCFDAPWNQRSPTRARNNSLTMIMLKKLEKRHFQISDAVQLLNKGFLFHIAVTSILTFTVATFNFYFYVLWLYGVPMTVMQFWYVPFLLSAIYQLVKFSMIAWVCETAKNEALKITAIIHDLLTTATDPAVRTELALFSLQVSHRDNTFCAKVVTINANLLGKIIGGIVMYILILFQFLLTSIHKSMGKSDPA